MKFKIFCRIAATVPSATAGGCQESDGIRIGRNVPQRNADIEPVPASAVRPISERGGADFTRTDDDLTGGGAAGSSQSERSILRRMRSIHCGSLLPGGRGPDVAQRMSQVQRMPADPRHGPFVFRPTEPHLLQGRLLQVICIFKHFI